MPADHGPRPRSRSMRPAAVSVGMPCRRSRSSSWVSRSNAAAFLETRPSRASSACVKRPKVERPGGSRKPSCSGDAIRTARLPSARCVTFARAGASPASNTIVRTPSRRNRVASLFIRAERASEYGGLGTIVVSRATRLETTAARRRPPLGAPAEVRDDDRDLRISAVEAARAGDANDRDADPVPRAEEVRTVAGAVHPPIDDLGGSRVRRCPGEVLACGPGHVAGSRPVPPDPPAERHPRAVLAELVAEVALPGHVVRMLGGGGRQTRRDGEGRKMVIGTHLVDPRDERGLDRIPRRDRRGGCRTCKREERTCEGRNRCKSPRTGASHKAPHVLVYRLFGEAFRPSKERTSGKVSSVRYPGVAPIPTGVQYPPSSQLR